MRVKPNQALNGIIWAYAGVHLLIAALLPLAAHEAHYALYARYLDWSYLDHPPLAVWLQALVLGLTQSDFALRLMPVALSVVTQYLLARLARTVYPAATPWLEVVCVLLLQGTLVFHGSMTLSPDVPLLPLALGVVLVSLQLEARGGLTRWLLLGVLLGLAGLSKYTAVTLAVSVLLIGLVSRGWRVLVSPGLWLTGAMAMLVVSPVLWWNWQHDWATVAFHTDYQFEDIRRWSLADFIESAVGQILYYSPLLVVGGIGVLSSLWRHRRQVMPSAAETVLVLFVLPVLLLYLVMALESRASPHWSLLGWILLIPLVANWLLHAWASAFWLRLLAWISGSCSAAIYLGFLLLAVPVGHWPDFRHPARLVSGWEAATERGRQLLASLPDRGFDTEPVLLARNWHHAGLIDWYARDVPVLNLFHDLNPHNFRTGLSDEHTWGILIYPRDSRQPRLTDLTRDFDCEPMEALPAYFGQSLVQVFHLYACYSRLPGSPVAGKPRGG